MFGVRSRTEIELGESLGALGFAAGKRFRGQEKARRIGKGLKEGWKKGSAQRLRDGWEMEFGACGSTT